MLKSDSSDTLDEEDLLFQVTKYSNFRIFTNDPLNN